MFRKQSTKIEELEKENKRLEKQFTDATTRWRKTEEQVEDLREASVDSAELREKLKEAEEKAASVESLVCLVWLSYGYMLLQKQDKEKADWMIERRNCVFTATELPTTISITPE